MSPRTKSYILLFIATLVWGVAGPVIKYTENYLSPLVFLLYRLAIAGGVGVVALSLTHHHNWPKSFGQRLMLGVYCFLTTTVGLGLLFLGYEKTSALTASVLNAFYPILVALVGMFFLHEHITHRENLGMGIALLGTALVVAEPLFNKGASSPSTMVGNLLIIASLVVGVIVTVMTKLILRHSTNPSSLTHLGFIIGFITLAPIVLYQTPVSGIVSQITHAPLMAHLGVVYMALLSGTFAYIIWDIGQKTIEIGESALFSYLFPLITLPLSIFWLHEPITWTLIAGSAIIGVGVVIAEVKKRKVSQQSSGSPSTRKHRRR